MEPFTYSAQITVDDGIRRAYADTPDVLDNHLQRIGMALRNFQQSLLGRNLNGDGLRIHVIRMTDENYVNGKFDPWHDEGNGTNHRLSQCTERCKER